MEVMDDGGDSSDRVPHADDSPAPTFPPLSGSSSGMRFSPSRHRRRLEHVSNPTVERGWPSGHTAEAVRALLLKNYGPGQGR